MANENVTQVIYDVSNALDELDRLNAKVKELEGQVSQNFRKAGNASSDFEKKLGVLSPRITSLLGDFQTLSAGISFAGVSAVGAFAAVGVAAAAVGARLIDLPELTKDAQSQFDAFMDSVNSRLELLKSGQGIADAFELEKFNSRIEDIRDTQAGIQDQQAAIGREKEGLQDRLAANTAYYNQLNALAKSSAQQRKQLEDSLASRQEKQFLRGIDKLPVEFQLKKLADEISKRRQSGDLEGAGRLLDRAQGIQDSSGSPFQARQLAEEEQKLQEALAKKAAAIKKTEDASKSNASTIRAENDAIKEQIGLLAKQSAELSRVRKELQAESKRVGLAKDAKEEDILTRQTAQERAAALAQFNALEFKQQGGIEKGLNNITLTNEKIFGGKDVRGQMEELVRATELYKKAKAEFAKNTPAGDVAGNAFINDLAKISEGLEVRADKADGLEFYRQGLKEAIELTKQLNAADIRRGGTERGFNQEITEDAPRETADEAGKTAEELSKSATGAKNMGDALDKAKATLQEIQRLRPDFSAPTLPQAPRATPGQAAPTAAPATKTENINVSMDVKANVIDEQLINQITDKVRRALRRDAIPDTKRA